MSDELKAEIRAMGKLPAILGPLSADSRRRVLMWLMEVYGEGSKGHLTLPDVVKVAEALKGIKDGLLRGEVPRAPAIPRPEKEVAPLAPRRPFPDGVAKVVPTAEKASYRDKRSAMTKKPMG